MRVSVVGFALSTTAVLLAGCGGINEALLVGATASRIEEARANGAEELAPYEYHAARDRIERAALETSAARYSDAARLVQEAEAYAAKAIEVAEIARHREP